MSVVVVVLIAAGVFFLSVAAIGVLRFPDVFTRSQALGLTDTFGALLMLLGLAIHQGPTLNALKILVVLVLLFLLNPMIVHAVVRAALRAGITPWTKEGKKSS